MSLLRHRREAIVTFDILGSQSAAIAGVQRVPTFNHTNWYLKKLHAQLGTAGITGTQTVDIHKGEGAGVTILGTTKIAFATTVATATYPSLGQIVLEEGALLQLINDAVHSGTAAKDLVVTMILSKIPQAAVVNTL